VLFSEPKIPQFRRSDIADERVPSFSALQRAENSSMLGDPRCMLRCQPVSVLFSEPKIPQFGLLVS